MPVIFTSRMLGYLKTLKGTFKLNLSQDYVKMRLSDVWCSVVLCEVMIFGGNSVLAVAELNKKTSTMEMRLDETQIQAIFLFEFKIGCKEGETIHNIKNAFGPGTANKHTVQWWFKKFHKGDESPEDEEHSGRPVEGDNDSLREIEVDPLTTT
ncbi:hypothetical protein AV530_011748 [Patagioenas fasciata monilis]|uniref:Mos1 transposase HTH domain-containing protein n=1 Tax=Patagioenas fasciata monilis TaxID=372326 RepID=A0A1V4KNF2_PATFA|nr:hypothetical protein AV530_011748 [Patagioenas fasciata monilis]